MSRNSLRLRLIAGGIAAIVLALALAGAGLTLLFERHVGRTVSRDLDVHLKKLLADLDVNAAGRITVTAGPVDPRFLEPMSGLYWQISDDRGQTLYAVRRPHLEVAGEAELDGRVKAAMRRVRQVARDAQRAVRPNL